MKTRYLYYQLLILFYALFTIEAAADPQTLVVPDQYPTIQSAIEAAAPGDTVQVKAGTYSENVVIDKEGIQLIGEGRNLVTVQTSATHLALDCGQWKTGLISGITFQQTNRTDNKIHYCVVAYGMLCSIGMKDCRIQNGDGDGIGIGNASPKITGCIIENNRGAGIAVDGTCAPEIRDNECQKNEDGIKFVNGGGKAEGNVCEYNTQYGIDVLEDTRDLTLKSNQCRDNWIGIGFDSGARGEAEENVCENNRLGGISVTGSGTSPTLKSNQCRNNKGSGIEFSTGARGDAEQNVCEYNTDEGIYVWLSGTTPTLKSNQCRDNQKSGVFYYLGAGGDFEENVCNDNKLDGIAVDSSEPHLDSNTCCNNGRDGIFCTADSSARIGDNNQVNGNQDSQIVTNGTDTVPIVP